jgi:hypothetical protein
MSCNLTDFDKKIKEKTEEADIIKKIKALVKKPITDAEAKKLIGKTNEWIKENGLAAIQSDRAKDVKVDKCMDDEFKLDVFLSITGIGSPIVSGKVKSNLEKMHSTILKPIVKFYKAKYSQELAGVCILQVYNGVSDVDATRTRSHGSDFSSHLTGEGCDFSILGVTNREVVEDITSGQIGIEYGVISLVNGIHITLPLNFEGHKITNLYIRSLDGGKKNIFHEFI